MKIKFFAAIVTFLVCFIAFQAQQKYSGQKTDTIYYDCGPCYTDKDNDGNCDNHRNSNRYHNREYCEYHGNDCPYNGRGYCREDSVRYKRHHHRGDRRMR